MLEILNFWNRVKCANNTKPYFKRYTSSKLAFIGQISPITNTF